LFQERPLAKPHGARAQISQYRRREQSVDTGGGEVKAEIGYKIGFLSLIPGAFIIVIGGRLIHVGRLYLAPSPEAALAAGMRAAVLYIRSFDDD
jgi:hypothetical protein